MGQEEIALTLVGLIYEAAVDPAKWPLFLEKFADALRGTVTAFVVYDTQLGDGNIAATTRVDPMRQRSYDEHYIKLDMWGISGKHLLTQGSVRLGQELCPNDLLVKSEFYNDFLKPMNVFHEVCGVVVSQRNAVSFISSMRPKKAGSFGEEELRLFRAVMPHLQRAVQLHSRIAELQAEAVTAVGALNHLHIGLIRLDRDSRVLAMNAAATAIVGLRDGLTVTHEGLCASQADETRHLRALVSSAAWTSEGRGFGAGGAMPISRPSLKRPFAALVSPAPATGLQLSGAQCAAVVLVTDPEAAIESSEEILKRLFGLTDREAQIAGLLVQGRDLRGICDDLSIRSNTARTHLRHLFEKLGVRRQSELVSLLLRTVGALRAVQSANQTSS